MSEYVKVILVTGGSSGLGQAMCKRLAAQGHTVFGTGRKVVHGQSDDGYTLLRMDITDEASVIAGVAEVLRIAGRIDVLVNNAGLGIQGPATDISPELALQLLDTNLLGAHRLCRAVLPAMRQQRKGLVINITSVAGNFGLPYRAFYSASKAALERYGEALAIEEQRFGITVVNVQPGEFNTPIAGARLRPDHISPEHEPGYKKAMEVLGGSMHYSRDPDELARVVARIIQHPKPKAMYLVAQGVQRVSVLAKKLLPGRMFQRMVGKHYE
ncbi:MAG: SDR family oxidoreductase [Flavobacteriales bacterium]|nr:SDR family oxidoreductase [Flavobacteriales bacterium]